MNKEIEAEIKIMLNEKEIIDTKLRFPIARMFVDTMTLALDLPYLNLKIKVNNPKIITLDK